MLKFRPTLETLDSRDVPTALTWTNAAGFLNPIYFGDATVAANWEYTNTTTVATAAPVTGDDLSFDGNVSDAPCTNLGALNFGGSGGGTSGGGFGGGGSSSMSGTQGLDSLSLINGYTGTLTVIAPLQVGTLTLNCDPSGAISQPFESGGNDITVTGTFTWNSGILNSSSNLANVNISGGTATFAPTSGGTVTLGSNINLENGAAGTINDGAIDENKAGIEFGTSTGSSLLISAGTNVLLGVTQYLQGQIGAGTSWTVGADATAQFRGRLTNLGGTFTLLSGATSEITGNPFNPLDNTYAYIQVAGATGATYLHSNSSLVTPNMSIAIDTGILATVYDSDTGTGNATIAADTLTVRGGDIYIDYGQGTQSHYHFGELLVVGNVAWTGGTFHPYVWSDGSTNDVWRTTSPDKSGGRFDIEAGATVDPTYVDSDYGLSSLPTSGTSWQILQTGGAFVDNNAPSLTNTSVWSMAIEPRATPATYWALIAN